MKKLVLLTVLLTGFITTAFADDAGKATEAYKKGDYTTAFKLFENPATLEMLRVVVCWEICTALVRA